MLAALSVVVLALSVQPSGSRLRAQAQQAPAISAAAVAQINALMAEKANRTPAQRKMNSRLVYAAKVARGQAVANGVATLDVGIPMTADNRVELDVRAEVTDALVAQVQALGGEVFYTSAEYRTLLVRASLAQVEAIAALPQVIHVQPKPQAATHPIGLPIQPGVRATLDRERLVNSLRQALGQGPIANVGPTTSEGDTTHKAFNARFTYGRDGTGVKVCVLSDGVANLVASQMAEELGPVTVLPGQAGPPLGDGGTAMLEIIHDLAPGAQLYFATGFTGMPQFATNIKALRTAGCDIIVDDVSYFAESVFQDGQTESVVSNTNGGIVTQAVKDVTAGGALYFSAAVNSGNLDAGTSGTWEGDFLDGGGGQGLFPGCEGDCRLHDFGFGPYDFVASCSGCHPRLFWADPLGGSGNDYDLFLFDNSGTTLIASSTDVQDGTQDPTESFDGVTVNTGDLLVIVKASGSDRFLHLDTFGGQLSFATSGSTRGHAATTAENSFGVAATPAQTPGPYPGPFNGMNVVETFSSDGPRRIFFNGDGTAITPDNFGASGGQVLSKPDITAADGVSVSGLNGPTTFYGTSAAAAHAAAIAALVKSANLSVTATEVRAALIGSAIDIHTTGIDRNSGAGIVMADTAVAAAAAPPVITSQPSSQTITPGATATLSVVATGMGLSYQWYAGSSGVTVNPVGANSSSYTTAALLNTTTYWVRVSNANVSVDSANAQVTVSVFFTDDPLTAASSVIKALHITELRTRIAGLRSRYGLPAFSFTDPTITAGTTTIKVQHIIDLRTALAQAYAAAARTPPTYTDPSLEAGVTPVKAVHITELRNAVVALE